ncbi:hypothetical protein [Nonomuraea coxensis]|nr:hypothetical protein [Nonomuraea coxensis]
MVWLATFATCRSTTSVNSSMTTRSPDPARASAIVACAVREREAG